MKDRKVFSITNVFQKFLDESGRKLDKIWVDRGKEFNNISMKSYLRDSDIEQT